MILASITYQPFKWLPWKRAVDIRLPSRWADLTPGQLVTISSLQSQVISRKEAMQSILQVKRSIVNKLDEYHAFSIFREMDFTRRPEAWHTFIIPEIAGLAGPAARLENYPFGAFIFGDTYYQDYVERGMEDDLNRFIACFYFNGAFSDVVIEDSAAMISRVDIQIRKAIAMNYVLVREWLARRYTYVFSNSGKGAKKKRRRDSGWIAVYDAVVGTDLVNAEKYAEKPLHTVLRFLNRRTMEYYKHGGKI